MVAFLHFLGALRERWTSASAGRLYLRLGVFQTGHFVYSSGRHGLVYVNKDILFNHPRVMRLLARGIARRHKHLHPEVVAGPVVGGAILAQLVAYELSLMMRREVLAAYADKVDDGFVFRRGYETVLPGRRTLCVEDVVNSGGSCARVIEAAVKLGARPVGVGTLFLRTELEVIHGVRLDALVRWVIDDFEPGPQTCPGCREGVILHTELGHARSAMNVL